MRIEPEIYPRIKDIGFRIGVKEVSGSRSWDTCHSRFVFRGWNGRLDEISIPDLWILDNQWERIDRTVIEACERVVNDPLLFPPQWMACE